MTLSYAQIEDLFRRYRDEMTRRLLGMVNSRETAADLLQETYVRILRLADSQTIDQPRALLHRIARNLATDHISTHKGGPNVADSLNAALEMPCPVPSQERMLLGKERLQVFVQAVENLPPRTREAFLLQRLECLSYREIGERMGIPLERNKFFPYLRWTLEFTCWYHSRKLISHINII